MKEKKMTMVKYEAVSKTYKVSERANRRRSGGKGNAKKNAATVKWEAILDSIRFRKEQTAGDPAERKNMERKIRNIIDATGHIFMDPDPDFR